MRWTANFWGVFFFILAVVTIVAQADDPKPPSTPLPKGPLSPEESLKHLLLADPNLVIEIVAAEPEVVDPVAIQFDEHGRLWVVEMRDYPNGPEPGQPPMSRIKLLEDKDGDGRYETAHVFADKLLFATGVQPWDGGVIVTLAGEVAYFKDTDGDHKADVRETWFTGFSESNPQLRANHPTFGPDGWIYVANGLRGGNVIGVKKDWPIGADASRVQAKDAGKGTRDASTTEPQPISLTGRDFKFDPLTGRYEAISGNGQFGMTFDAWGNRFVCDNRHPCRHVIFEEDLIKRCPHVAFPAVVNDVIPADDKNKVFPLTSAWTTSNLHAGTFTASCGVTVYTGDWLPEEFRGNVFVCEPTGNLVQRAILEPDGVTFKSRNPYERSRHAPRDEPNASPTSKNNSTSREASGDVTRSVTATLGETGTQEFLASRDDWFRPVDLQNGPDGALYVVDMYRAVIEHPEWVPDELKKRPDTWLGNDKGRIYRIRPSRPVAPRQDQPSARSTSEKQSTSTARSAALSRSDRATLGKPIVSVVNFDASFNSSNGWHRMTAARIRREKASDVPKLEASALNTDYARCLAIQLETEAISSNPSFALPLLLESCGWPRARFMTLVNRSAWTQPSKQGLLRLALQDSHPRVRLQGLMESVVAGNWWSGRDDVTAERMIVDAGDQWLRLAYVAAFTVRPESNENGFWWTGSLFTEWDSLPHLWNQEGIADVASLLGDVVGGHSRPPHDDLSSFLSDVERVFKASEIARVEVKANAVLGVAKGLARKGTDIRQLAQKDDTAGIQEALDDVIDEADRLLASPTTIEDPQARTAVLAALRVFKFAKFARVAPWLKPLAESSEDQTIRLVALESFVSFQNPEVDAWLIERYRSETPAIRRAILAALFASKERQLRLLEAIEQGQIAATELDPVRVNQLTQSKDETLRERAKKILAAAAPASRKEVLDAYQSALSLKGDPQRGKAVFVKNCSTCHRVDNIGVNVAPDISDTRTKKPEQLLMDILDPNKAIDANYFAYAVVTKEGKTESGVISSESSNSITLKQPEGKVLTLLRSDIEEIRNTGLSLMPVGVEKNIDKQALADLIFWLKNWRYLDGKVPATSIEPK